MKEPIFTGAGVAIITPFTEDGVNFEEFGRIIEDQIAGGTDAIVVTGTTGEAAAMSDAEHKEAIKFVVETVGGRIPVIAGTGSNDTNYAIQLSQYAEKAGANGLLLVTPYYNKCTQGGLVKHFSKIADNVNIPSIVYNVPSRTGVNILPATYARLAEHRHLDDDKARGERLIEVARSGIAVVHRRDEARRRMHAKLPIARHIEAATVIQEGVQHGKRLVARHVDLIEDRHTPRLGAGTYGTGAKAHGARLERVHADKRRRIRMDME